MGVISEVLAMIFGNQRNLLRETAEVFRENSEGSARRAHAVQIAALNQLGAEFQQPRNSRFDRFMDGMNRLPRPMLALGTLGLMTAALVDPIWFAARMQGLALVPEPLWWLLGVVVSFYFGARHQIKTQEFQQGLAASMARVPQAVDNNASLHRLRATTPGAARTGTDAADRIATTATDDNPALEAWLAQRG